MSIYRLILCLLVFFTGMHAEDLRFLSSNNQIDTTYRVDGKVFVWGVQENAGRIMGGFNRVAGRIEAGQGLMVSDAYGKVAVSLDSWESEGKDLDASIQKLLFAGKQFSNLVIDIENVSGLFHQEIAIGEQGEGVLSATVSVDSEKQNLKIPVRFLRVSEVMWVLEADRLFDLDFKKMGFESEMRSLAQELQSRLSRQVKIFFRFYLKKAKV
ncbi:MAG: hypothetical protein CMO81_10895 [Waddliaceae bacterium]|nr:hypothetical protein [Waddliaceae bacterium]